MTWLNHHSARSVDAFDAELEKLDFVGIDGLLLLALLGRSMPRTSADLLLPLLLPRLHGASVALVGGEPGALPHRAAHVRRLLPADASIVANVDGYSGLPPARELAERARAERWDVVLVGLGAGLQDRYAAAVRSRLDHGLVLTCGGFLDQVPDGGYYPRWAYPLRLNWAVRLAREPRRMWRRYSVEAAQALCARTSLQRLRNSGGVRRLAEALS